MNKLNTILKLLIVVVLALYISIIVINKRTIDEFNNKDALENNTDTLRGVLWANYTFIIVTFAIILTIIITKKKYKKYKWIILISMLYILLNTSLSIYVEIMLKDKVEKSVLNNVYIISSTMNIIYFMIIVYLMTLTNKLLKHKEFTYQEVDEYIRNGHYTGYYPNNIYNNDEYDDYTEYNIENDIENDINPEITADDIAFDDELGIVIKPRRNRI